jgi:hypothetical protein
MTGTRSVRSHTRNGRRVAGYRQTYQSRAAMMADVGVGVAVAAGTLTSMILDLAGLLVNITGMLVAALFGARWTHRNRHSIRLRKLRRQFRSRQQAKISRRPARSPRQHDSAPWAGTAPWSGKRSGTWRVHDDGRTIERVG